MARRSSSPLVECRLAAGFTRRASLRRHELTAARSGVGNGATTATTVAAARAGSCPRNLAGTSGHASSAVRVWRGGPRRAWCRSWGAGCRSQAPCGARRDRYQRGRNRPDLAGVAEDAREASRFARRAGASVVSRSALDQIRLEVRGSPQITFRSRWPAFSRIFASCAPRCSASWKAAGSPSDA